MVAIAVLAWLSATEWEDQRLSERVMDTMARTLRPAQEARGPTISSQAPAVAAAPAEPGAPAAAASAVATAAQTAPAPLPSPAPVTEAPVAAVKPVGPETVAGSGTVTTEAAPPAEAAPPEDEDAPKEATSSSTKVASVKAGESPRKRESRKAAAAEESTPRAACGNRVQFSLYYCMQTQCRKPQYYKHAQCRALRERDTVQD